MNGTEDRDTDVESQFEDPEFAALALTIPVDEAMDAIDDTMKGLHATPTDVGVKVRTTDGRLVAVVQEGHGDAGSVLQYRTEPASELATRKARKLGEALESFAADTEAVTSQ